MKLVLLSLYVSVVLLLSVCILACTNFAHEFIISSHLFFAFMTAAIIFYVLLVIKKIKVIIVPQFMTKQMRIFQFSLAVIQIMPYKVLSIHFFISIWVTYGIDALLEWIFNIIDSFRNKK